MEVSNLKMVFASAEGVLTLLLIQFFTIIGAADIKDQIFVRVEKADLQCLRFLNGTHSVGCQSNRFGNIGILTEIFRPAEVQVALNNLPFRIPGIITVVDVDKADRELIDVLRSNDGVVGIIFIDYQKGKPNRFSEDEACPNRQFSFYKNERNGSCHGWNQQHAVHPDGLKFIDFGKPIRLVTNLTEIDLIIEKCLNPFNKNSAVSGIRCMGRMTQFMSAAGNAKICLERTSDLGVSLCDVLQDQNVFAMLPPLSEQDEAADQFVLATRIDTFSTIRNAKGGDLSVLSSILAQLSVAHAIGQHYDLYLQNTNKTGRQLLFAFLHGESLGYIGSSRWIWDMDRGHFPADAKNFPLPSDNVRKIGVNALSFFLELQQIGTSSQIFAHTDKNVYARDNNSTLIDSVLANAHKGSGSLEFVDPNTVHYDALPPSSYHTVLKASTHVPGLVLSSFGAGQYNFGYLNSYYDDQIRGADTANFNDYLDRIIMASNVALKASLAYVFRTNESTILDEFKIDRHYVENLGECFFKSNWRCSLFRTLTNATHNAQMDNWLRESANVLSIGGESYNYRVMPSIIRQLVFTLLVNSIGNKKSAENVRTQTQCRDLNSRQSVYNFVWMNDAKGNASCYRTSIYQTIARSPAFEIQDYDFSSGQYSSWVVSNWDAEVSFELYLKADYRLELFAFLAAIAVLLASIPLHFGPKEQWFLDNSLPPGSPQQL